METLMVFGAVGLAGLIAGLTVAMPFGPVGQLAARLTTEKKRRAARELAYVAVGVDAIFSGLVMIFLNYFSTDLVWHHPLLQVGLGVVFILLGVQMWFAAPCCMPGELPGGFKQPWQFAAVYSLFYPGSILIFIATFGALQAQGLFMAGAYSVTAQVVCWLAVVLGMVLMWVIWLGLVHHLKRKMNIDTLRMIFARGVGLTLLLTGMALLLSSRFWQSFVA